MVIDPGFNRVSPSGFQIDSVGRNIDPGFNRGPVGGYDPKILSQRRQAILQKMMAQHATNLPQNGGQGATSGMNAVAQASHAQAGGVGGRRTNAAKVNVTGGQNLSASILARLGLTTPRALPGERSDSPGGAIEHPYAPQFGQSVPRAPSPGYAPQQQIPQGGAQLAADNFSPDPAPDYSGMYPSVDAIMGAPNLGYDTTSTPGYSVPIYDQNQVAQQTDTANGEQVWQNPSDPSGGANTLIPLPGISSGGPMLPQPYDPLLNIILQSGRAYSN